MTIVLLLSFACLALSVAPPKHEVVREAEEGQNTVLQCSSVDDEHVFLFWYSAPSGVIGPRNKFDAAKFHYEVISGNLTIRRAARRDSGLYSCVSEGITAQDIAATTVQLLVQGGPFSTNTPLWTAWAVLAILLVVLLMLYVALLRHYKKLDKSNLRRYFDMSEANEDEDSTEELFTREPSTSGTVLTKSSMVENGDNFERMYAAVDINHTRI